MAFSNVPLEFVIFGAMLLGVALERQGFSNDRW
jgi:hypothetical protein